MFLFSFVRPQVLKKAEGFQGLSPSGKRSKLLCSDPRTSEAGRCAGDAGVTVDGQNPALPIIRNIP